MTRSVFVSNNVLSNLFHWPKSVIHRLKTRPLGWILPTTFWLPELMRTRRLTQGQQAGALSSHHIKKWRITFEKRVISRQSLQPILKVIPSGRLLLNLLVNRIQISGQIRAMERNPSWTVLKWKVNWGQPCGNYWVRCSYHIQCLYHTSLSSIGSTY